jgi:anti-anti-sigma regulatory factor
MEVTHTQLNDVDLFELKGRFSADVIDEFENALNHLIGQGRTQFVFDLKNIEYFGAMAISMFFRVRSNCFLLV